MPARDLQKDLRQVKSSGLYTHLCEIKSGDIDDSICFSFPATPKNTQIDLQAIVSQPQGYPTSHNFIVYTTSDEVPPAVTRAVEDILPLLEGVTIHETLTLVENVVFDALNGANGQTSTLHDGPGDSGEDEIFDDFNLEDSDSYDAFDEDDFYLTLPNSTSLRHKLRRDLRAAKNAGYKVGYLGHIEGCIILSIASRIARLGISDEAMKAWSVQSSDYLVLLIRYNRAYQTLQELSEMGDMAKTFVHMRVGLCDSYKPSLNAAVEAFQGKDAVAAGEKPCKPNLRSLFIGTQLDKLLNERFLGIVKHRMQYGFSWTGAEHFFHVSQGKQLGPDDASAPEYLEPDSWATPPPAYLVSDHMGDTGLAMAKISLPLLAMQFLLRHFVRCTEFCLVCHCRKYDDYEALRPYVCSNGLCLYQYITFGMGPSLEYEIIFQPYVVDLLVSLAYARAKSGHLEDFPKGLGLQVPHTGNSERGDGSDLGPFESPKSSEFHEATFDYGKMELSGLDISRLKVGDWIRILFSDVDPNINQSSTPEWHCRIQHVGETSKHVGIAYPLRGGRQLSAEDIHGAHKGSLKQVKVRCAAYNKKFDDLPPAEKRWNIVMLLNTLPGIETMTGYLKSGSNRKLSSWRNRISPAALDLLRWIVASNRSCILQDSCDREHLVSGMQDYLQFRLVQGAPDKEQRFLRAIDQHAMRKKSQYPTVFAWHGSPVHNWHSILREGLHYKQIAHGRAYGDGVYMSRCFRTSNTYSGHYVSPKCWPQSGLDIRSVISLNEVVNATEKFAYREPYYVVQQLDWIQPRYLFVGTARTPGNGTNSAIPTASGANASLFSQTNLPEVGEYASVIFKQDPSFPVNGPDGKPIKIPISAFSSKRRWVLSSTEQSDFKKEKANGKKKRAIPRKASSLSEAPSSHSEACKIFSGDGDLDETASVMTATEDLNILLSDSEDEASESPSKKHKSDKKRVGDVASMTDFMPGSMKEDSLPLISPPQYATSRATMTLQKHLQATLKVQEKEQLHELGWFVDPSLIRTVYQWIVELHTFDKDLPLAQDMKKAKLQSVVLELRFPPEFPMDPPFVRVIRPRFLEFQSGGGGHVTLGGAMCMELLTNSGWSAATSIESLLLQVRLAISSTDPRPGRLAHYGQDQDYKIGEAIASYKRACMAHGWAIPKDMERISW